MGEKKIETCPFCGYQMKKEEVVVVNVNTIVCCNCHAQGPDSMTVGWNDRATHEY